MTRGDHGNGVIEVVDALTADDLKDYQSQLGRHDLELGECQGRVVTLPAYGATILVCGASGSGKSTVVTWILETLVEKQYQFCLVDPEGDYQGIEGAMVIGGSSRLSDESEVLQAISDPKRNAVADLTGMPIAERPKFLAGLLPRLLQMRTRLGRPHWMIFDEAHHVMPSDWKPTADALPERLHSTLLVTNHPDLLSRTLLNLVDILVAVGEKAGASLRLFCESIGEVAPNDGRMHPAAGQVILWKRKEQPPPALVTPYLSEIQRRRHRRKYVEGQLTPAQCFYFRGPDKKLNLPATNLTSFLQLADGVDDATWEFHRQRQNYSVWFRSVMGDNALADLVAAIESNEHFSPAESRAQIRAVIERQYDMHQPSALQLPGTL